MLSIVQTGSFLNNLTERTDPFKPPLLLPVTTLTLTTNTNSFLFLFCLRNEPLSSYLSRQVTYSHSVLFAIIVLEWPPIGYRTKAAKALLKDMDHSINYWLKKFCNETAGSPTTSDASSSASTSTASTSTSSSSSRSDDRQLKEFINRVYAEMPGLQVNFDFLSRQNSVEGSSSCGVSTVGDGEKSRDEEEEGLFGALPSSISQSTIASSSHHSTSHPMTDSSLMMIDFGYFEQMIAASQDDCTLYDVNGIENDDVNIGTNGTLTPNTNEENRGDSVDLMEMLREMDKVIPFGFAFPFTQAGGMMNGVDVMIDGGGVAVDNVEVVVDNVVVPPSASAS